MNANKDREYDPNFVPVGAGIVVFGLGMLAGVALTLWSVILARVLMV